MARKTGLGRGLDALIPTGEPDFAGGILIIPVENIQPNPRQPRTAIRPEDISDLADSIREHGILQPLIVTSDEQDNTHFILIAGERRWLAAQQAGLDKVPAIVRDATDQQRLEFALIENVQRNDLNPLEMAEAYRQLSIYFQLTHEEIAARVFKSRSSVSNTLRLINLPMAAKTALAEGKISEGHARALLTLPSQAAMEAALNTILRLDLSVRQAEELVKNLTGQRIPRLQKSAPTAEILEMERRLQSRLRTRVNLSQHKKGGTIVIYYYSDEELNSLLDTLLKEEIE